MAILHCAIRKIAPSIRRCLSTSSTSAPASGSVSRLTVFGAGLMGAGIAQVAAHNGIKVVLTDTSDSALLNGRSIIEKSLARIARKAHPDALNDQKSLVDEVFSNISFTTEAREAVQGVDLVVEAIVENMKVKQQLFAKLDGLADPTTVFASNTSSLSITEIASSTSQARQKKFAGLHYFNPVPQMKLVEVIRTKQTDDETFDKMLHLAKTMKKTPVACLDTPGFIVNRLLVPYMLEALRLVERGEATPEDVDTAMKLGAGMPMGPFELSDYVGLDTLKHIADGWRESRVHTGEIDGNAVAPVSILNDKVANKKLGRKTGEGFFKY